MDRKGERRVCMTDPTADGDDIEARRDERRDVAMAKGMEGAAREAHDQRGEERQRRSKKSLEQGQCCDRYT